MSTYNLPEYNGLNVGDETRRHGDYIGFEQSVVSDGTAVADLGSFDRGVPVTGDGSGGVQEATDPAADDVAGILYAFDVYGDSSNAGPYVDGDSKVTVKTSGSVIADLSGFTSVAEADEGTAVGPNGELLVVEVLDASNDIAEVLLR